MPCCLFCVLSSFGDTSFAFILGDLGRSIGYDHASTFNRCDWLAISLGVTSQRTKYCIQRISRMEYVRLSASTPASHSRRLQYADPTFSFFQDFAHHLSQKTTTQEAKTRHEKAPPWSCCFLRHALLLDFKMWLLGKTNNNNSNRRHSKT